MEINEHQPPRSTPERNRDAQERSRAKEYWKTNEYYPPRINRLNNKWEPDPGAKKYWAIHEKWPPRPHPEIRPAPWGGRDDMERGNIYNVVIHWTWEWLNSRIQHAGQGDQVCLFLSTESQIKNKFKIHFVFIWFWRYMLEGGGSDPSSRGVHRIS